MIQILHPTRRFHFVGLVVLSALVFLCVLTTRDSSAVQLFDKWNLTADEVNYRSSLEIFEARGKVFLTNEENYLIADFARYYMATGWVYLKGNVQAKWKGDTLQAESAEFNLKDRTGYLKNGSLFLSDPQLHFNSTRIEKINDIAYRFGRAEVTACDERPAPWSIEAKKGKIRLDGAADLSGPRLKVLDTPVVWLPRIVLPARRERKSGLLIPRFGVSSRLGVTYNQPYYFAVNNESDVTLYEQYMSKRGFMHGVEFRHTPDADSIGYWRFDYLFDDVTEDSFEDEDDQFDDDVLLRPNRSRYWWRSKYDGRLFDPRWRVKLDVDIVSDQNYLREFSEGKSGYRHSRDVFLERFHRDIDDADAVSRTSTLLVERSFERFGLAARADYTRNNAFFNENFPEDDDDTPQQVPRLEGYVFRDSLLGLPLEWELETSASNYHRVAGQNGRRLELAPALSLPMRFGPLSFIPSVKATETVYFISGDDVVTADTGETPPGMEVDPKSGEDAVSDRFLPELAVESYTELARSYPFGPSWPDPDEEDVGKSSWSTLRHAMQPRLEYRKIFDTEQSNNPFFIEEDRIDSVNEIRYSLTNLLARRRDRVVRSENEAPMLVSDSREFLRLRLEQAYDIEEADRDVMTDRFPNRPFTDFEAELSFVPDEYIRLSSRSFLNPYSGRITRHEHKLALTWPQLATLRFSLDLQNEIDDFKRQDREAISIMNLNGDIFFTPEWSLFWRYRADLEEEEDLEKSVFLTYKTQCWSVTAGFSAETFENRFSLSVDLLGFDF
jgi:LPS-assembly protein